MHLIQGRAYTVSWWVQIKATSDLWLFIHASNLLPSHHTPLLYTLRTAGSGTNMIVEAT